jgi:hypothetical protein
LQANKIGAFSFVKNAEADGRRIECGCIVMSPTKTFCDEELGRHQITAKLSIHDNQRILGVW